MEYASIYKNGKVDRFFLKLDDEKEFAFIQPYFISTKIDAPRTGRIYEMDCLFSGSVFSGRQGHGFGYSASADVYGQLVAIIEKLHKARLTEQDRAALDKINTHENKLIFPVDLLDNLRKYNDAELAKKYGW